MTQPPTSYDVADDVAAGVPPAATFQPVWLSPDDVLAWLALHGQEGNDADLVVRCCAASEPYVESCRPEWWTGEGEQRTYSPDAETYQGAVMHAAREVRRRNSVAGVQVFGEAGIAFVARYDPDIERALRTGSWTRPGVG